MALPACSLFGGTPPEPLRPFNVRPVGEGALVLDCVVGSSRACKWSASGPLAAITGGTLGDLGYPPASAATPYVRLHLTDASGDTTALDLLGVTLGDVPLEAGRAYDVDLFVIPTTTGGLSTLLVRDGDGLAFYGTTTPSAPPPAVPGGWSFVLEPAGYGARDAGCGVRATPLALAVEHGGRRLRLVQGERGRLGPYVVEARLAESLDYSAVSCLDANFSELSVIGHRSPRS